MTSHRVLVSDPLDPAALEVFRSRGVETEVRTGLGEEELCRALAGVHALVVRSSTRVTPAVLEAADDLRVVGRAGIGVDNVDCDAATERGVVVMNTPTGNATTTAEHALALLVSLARHVPRADAAVRAGRWKQKKDLLGTELTGKTLGVVGLGRIGRLVAERAQGLRMQVVAHDPYLPAGDGSPVPGVELLELRDLLARCDFVSLHVPLTETTRHLISWEELAAIRPGARLVNASRGGVVDEEAVVDALAEGRLAGAAFDVFESEPPASDHPLLSRTDVIVTPHLGASSHEAQHRVAVDIARQVCDFLIDGVAENAVNTPPLPADVRERLAPFLSLAQRMGSLVAQRIGGPVRKLELTLSGEVAEYAGSHVRIATLVGLLRHVADGVNTVNAQNLARERGIRVLESSDEARYFTHGQIKLRASTRGAGDSRVVAGTVFGREPRIVRIDDVHLDLPPRGPILITRHRDVPGVLGQIGTVLGRCGVNIQRVELGPPQQAGDGGAEYAAGFLTLYEDPPDAVLDELAALEPIEAIQLVRL